MGSLAPIDWPKRMIRIEIGPIPGCKVYSKGGYMKRIIVTLAMTALVSTTLSAPAFADGWGRHYSHGPSAAEVLLWPIAAAITLPAAIIGSVAQATLPPPVVVGGPPQYDYGPAAYAGPRAYYAPAPCPPPRAYREYRGYYAPRGYYEPRGYYGGRGHYYYRDRW
jgi:hypothetical protein